MVYIWSLRLLAIIKLKSDLKVNCISGLLNSTYVLFKVVT
ncbi:hypothetical protein EAVNVH72_03421 [Elizabethkingia anophelis]|nr:hypothetical protein EAVNVH72_03421 [Elizabethkingia anophelis]